jgi:hypothetical protein
MKRCLSSLAVLIALWLCVVAWGQQPDSASSPTLSLVQSGMLDPQMKRLKGLAFDSQDSLYVAGETGVRLFDSSGILLREMNTTGPANCVAVAPLGQVYVGLRDSVVVFDPKGKQSSAWGEKGTDPGQFFYIASIAVSGDRLYVADAGNSCIHRFAPNGDYADGLSGFNIPSPYFDCAVDKDSSIWVTNTGEHRAEHYDTNLKRIGAWGVFGADAEGFSGCCNPTNIALLGNGRIATTEKGTPRLKVYDAEGHLLARLGPETFPPTAAGMDLAVDSKGRIALLEPVESKVRFYVLASTSFSRGDSLP